MAGPADQLFGLAQQSIQNREGDLSAGVKLGAQIQQTQIQRQDIELKKKQIDTTKWSAIAKGFTTMYDKVPKSAQRAYFKNFLMPQAASLGKPMDPSIIDALLSPDVDQVEAAKAMIKVVEGSSTFVKTGQMPEGMEGALANMAKFNQGDTSIVSGFLSKNIGQQVAAEAQVQSAQAAATRQAKTLVAQDIRQGAAIEGQAQKQRDLIAATGIKSADAEFGKETSRFRAAGGQKTIEKNIGLLDDAIKDLQKPGKLSGSLRHLIPLLNDDSVTDVVDPKLAAVRDKIKGAIQATLKETLGAQFAEKEGEAIYNRAFNPRLDDKENIRRAKVEVDALKAMSKSKLDRIKHFEKTGSTANFVPNNNVPMSAALEAKATEVAKASLASKKFTRAQLEVSLKKRYPNASNEQIQRILGAK